MDPLYALLRPGMKVTIAIDDISLPLPPMRRPDVRERVLTIVLELPTDHGVDDVDLIIAHRPAPAHDRAGDPPRRRRQDLRRVLPRPPLQPRRRRPEGMMQSARPTSARWSSSTARRVESDLAHLREPEPRPDGRRAQVGRRRPLRLQEPQRAPQPADDAQLPLVHGPVEQRARHQRRAHGPARRTRRSTSSPSRRRINNRMFDRPLEFLAQERGRPHRRRADGASKALTLHALEAAAGGAPGDLPAGALARTASPASSRARPRRCTRTRSRAATSSTSVPVKGQADILVTRHPVHQPVQRELVPEPAARAGDGARLPFNLYKGAPLVKKGGTMIITHPCTDQFDKEHHAPYIEFVTTSCPRRATRWSCTSATRRSSRRTRRTSRCTARGTPTTPLHPFFMWYWGAHGLAHVGQVIFVGGDPEACRRLGFRRADTMRDALENGGAGRRPGLLADPLPLSPAVLRRGPLT